MGAYAKLYSGSGANPHDSLMDHVSYALTNLPIDRFIQISCLGVGVDLLIDPKDGSIYNIINKNPHYNVLYLGTYPKLKPIVQNWVCGELFTIEPEGLIVKLKSNNLLLKLVGNSDSKVSEYWVTFFFELNGIAVDISNLSYQQPDPNGRFNIVF